MPKLRVLSGAEVCRILQAAGFEKVRQAGSHIVMRRQLPGRGITVPVPNHAEISRGTLASIIQQSELPRELFMTG